MTGEWSNETYTIGANKTRLDVEAIHRTRALTQRVAEHSLCFEVYQRSVQVGFARVVTDYAVFAYLADVFARELHRRQKLGKWLVKSVMPERRLLRRPPVRQDS